MAIDVFISYAHADRDLRDGLAKHLSVLRNQGVINTWFDGDVIAGTEWESQINEHMKTAQIILLLISPDYMVSDSCHNIEMMQALGRHEAHQACIIPIILRPTDWISAPFAKLKTLPSNGKAVTLWHNRDEAFLNVVEGIKRAIHDLQNGTIQPRSTVSNFTQRPLCNQNMLSGMPSATTAGTTQLIFNKHTGRVNSVAWSPDGKRIASAGGDGFVLVWGPDTGQDIYTYRGHFKEFLPRTTAHVWKALWSPDGQYIASSGFGTTVHVWDSRTGIDIHRYCDHKAFIPLPETYAITWSPDGKRIASACHPKQIDQTVHVWDALTGQHILKYSGHDNNNPLVIFSVSDLAWSPNGQYIASSGSDRNIKKWKPDPTVANRSIQIWNPATVEHIATCHIDSTWTNDIAWSPDSRYLASAEPDATVNIWEATTGRKVFSYKGHAKAVRSVAWSPDGSIIASAGNDYEVRLWYPWPPHQGKLFFIYQGHTNNVLTLAWSPDGKRMASAGEDKTVRIWQAVEG